MIFRRLVLSVTFLLIAVILLGFSGGFFAPGDSAAIVRPQAGFALLLLSVILFGLRARWMALTSAMVAAVAIGTVAPGFLKSGTDCDAGCLVLYQKNLLSKAWPRYPLADDIIESGAQVVTLQEVSDHNLRYMANMYDHYPASVICPFRPAQNVAVLTSLPVVEGSAFCLNETGLAGVQVKAPNGQLIWVLSLHLEWPFPYGQDQQSRKIADHIATLNGPVLIGGDFNMVPWGASLSRIKHAANADRLGPFRNTYKMGSPLLPLPIDNILVPKGLTGTTALRPYMGSDHLGTLARIGLR
ncbi:MAG: endonuclease/exonuclease/phosphatase family protein [Marinosulfonomonas sp.]